MEFEKINSKSNQLIVTPEVARIHAHVCGDGSVYIKNSKRGPSELSRHKRRNIYRKDWTIEYYNSDLDLVKEFVNDFKVVFNRNIKTIQNKIKFRSVKHIVKKLELVGKNSYNWNIPDFINNGLSRVRIEWLRAFFDDEAHVGVPYISVSSVNEKGIKQIQNLLHRLGINSKVLGPYHQIRPCDNTFYRLTIRGQDVPKYYNLIGFTHTKKYAQLKNLVEEKWGGRKLPG